MSHLVKQEQPQEAATIERTRESATYTPRFDIWETDEELILCGDLPGVESGDLDIRFENRELTVKMHHIGTLVDGTVFNQSTQEAETWTTSMAD